MSWVATKKKKRIRLISGASVERFECVQNTVVSSTLSIDQLYTHMYLYVVSYLECEVLFDDWVGRQGAEMRILQVIIGRI